MEVQVTGHQCQFDFVPFLESSIGSCVLAIGEQTVPAIINFQLYSQVYDFKLMNNILFWFLADKEKAE